MFPRICMYYFTVFVETEEEAETNIVILEWMSVHYMGYIINNVSMNFIHFYMLWRQFITQFEVKNISLEFYIGFHFMEVEEEELKGAEF